MNAMARTFAEAEHAGASEGSTTRTLHAFPRMQRGLELLATPTWANEVLSRMTYLLKLKPGWDGYRAPAISRDATMFALEILQHVMRSGTPVPSIVPTSMGGVQIEWHCPRKEVRDIEIHVLAPYKGTYGWEDMSGDNEAELGTDLAQIRELVGKL